MAIDKRHKRSDTQARVLHGHGFHRRFVPFLLMHSEYVGKYRPADVVSLGDYVNLKLCPVASAGVVAHVPFRLEVLR